MDDPYGTREALTKALTANLPRCGDCDKWMKSRECPRERNVKGMSRGPSCHDFTCDQFAAKHRH